MLSEWSIHAFLLDEVPEEMQFVVISAQFNGKWLFVRNKERTTFEIPGGHIEENEPPFEAAKRELFEESGAADFALHEVCPYAVENGGVTTTGMLYYAEIYDFADLPDFEIAERVLLDEMPREMTYPHIQPMLMDKVREWLSEKKTPN